MSKMTKRQFEEMFRAEILPRLAEHERTGFPDKPGRRQAWNDTIDAYIRDRVLPEAAGNWSHPRWLETARVKGARVDYSTKKKTTKKSPAQLHHATMKPRSPRTEAIHKFGQNRPKKSPTQLDREIAAALAREQAAREETARGPSLQDIREFRGFLRQASDRQVQEIFDKETAAGREEYADLAREEARARGIYLEE